MGIKQGNLKSQQAPTVVEPVLDEPVQGFTPINFDNLLTARWLASLFDEPIVFITKIKIELMPKQEMEWAFTASIC